jgi:hypothetical protein
MQTPPEKQQPAEKCNTGSASADLKSALAGNSALAKPVAHIEFSGSVVFQQAAPSRYVDAK